MKVIFLDIDGVLNSEEWMVRRFNETEGDLIASQYPYYEFDKKLVENLNKIIKATDAKVVVSSTWRLGRSAEELQKLLTDVGFIGEVIDITPHFGAPKGFGYTIPRGCEIEWWLKENGKFQRINWSIATQREYIEKAIVKNYVILDDDSDMLLGQREHFVKTHWKWGLSDSCVEEAIKILNTPVEKLYYDIDWSIYAENV